MSCRKEYSRKNSDRAAELQAARQNFHSAERLPRYGADSRPRLLCFHLVVSISCLARPFVSLRETDLCLNDA